MLPQPFTVVLQATVSILLMSPVCIYVHVSCRKDHVSLKACVVIRLFPTDNNTTALKLTIYDLEGHLEDGPKPSALTLDVQLSQIPSSPSLCFKFEQQEIS